MLNLLGGAMALRAGVEIDWTALVEFQAVISSAQLAGAMANEYADLETDSINRNRTWFSGGSGVIGRGKLPRTYALHLCIIWSALGLAAALWACSLPLIAAMGEVRRVTVVTSAWGSASR